MLAVVLGLAGSAIASSAQAATTASVPLNARLGFQVDGEESQEGFGEAAGIGDFNGDGLDDLVVQDAAEYEDRWQGRVLLGQRRFPRRQTTEGRRPVAVYGRIDADAIRFASAGDVNGDGRGDFVVTDSPRAWVVFGRRSRRPIDLRALGRGGFELQATTDPGQIGSVSGVGDLDGDGRDELEMRVRAANPRADGSTGGRVLIAFGKAGAGTLIVAPGRRSTAVIDPPPDAPDFGFNVVGVGDADGDRVTDLAIAAIGTGMPAGYTFPMANRIQIGLPPAPGAAFLVSGRLVTRGATINLSSLSAGWLRIAPPPGAGGKPI